MILRFKTRVGALFNSDAHIDEIRTAFENETQNLEDEINTKISDKCTYSFLAGMLITGIIFGISFYIQGQGFGEFKEMLFGAL